MMKSKNLTLYIAIGIIVIFSFVYFIVANKVSYAFDYDDKEELYNSRIMLIKKAAENYGEKNDKKFKDNTLYITVDELVKDSYLIADDDKGNYLDPRSEVKTLNNIKIRVQKDKKGHIKTTILK